MADTGLMVRVVGAPESREFAVQVGAFVGELGRAQPVDGIGAPLLADLQQLVADLLVKLQGYQKSPTSHVSNKIKLLPQALQHPESPPSQTPLDAWRTSSQWHRRRRRL